MDELIPKQQNESEESGSSSSIAAAIRQLRHDLGLTQVQLAVEVGITPTTVYRYEAATNTPTNDILAKILQFAVKKQSLGAVQTLAEILASRTGLNMFGSDMQSETPFLRSLASLRLEKRLLIMAALFMLQEDADQTAIRVFEHLVEPWKAKASLEFGSFDIALSATSSPKEQGARVSKPKEKR